MLITLTSIIVDTRLTRRLPSVLHTLTFTPYLSSETEATLTIQSRDPKCVEPFVVGGIYQLSLDKLDANGFPLAHNPDSVQATVSDADVADYQKC